jgi:SAM-dependent methyltransferase
MEWGTVLKYNLCDSSDILNVDEGHNIGRCRGCGYVFAYKRPGRNEIAEYYSLPIRYDDWNRKEWDDLWKRRLSMVRRYKSSGCQLDVGTGTGQFLHSAEQYFQVTGTEISESAIAKQKHGLDIVKGEIEDLHFDCKFLLVTLFHVLEHVHDPAGNILRFRSLLSENGLLLCCSQRRFRSTSSHISGLSFLKIMGRFRKCGAFGENMLTIIRRILVSKRLD